MKKSSQHLAILLTLLLFTGLFISSCSAKPFGGKVSFSPINSITQSRSTEFKTIDGIKGESSSSVEQAAILPLNEASTVKLQDENAIEKNKEKSERKIVKNAALSLLVSQIDLSVEKITKEANKFHGFVLSSQVSESSPESRIISASITIKVPNENFEQALKGIKKIAIKVESESINAEDVTEQFVDLESRLKNLRVEEAQCQEIMTKANSVDEILKVSQRMNDVRGEIEQSEGRLKYLSRQVNLSTITINLISEDNIKVFGIKWKPILIIKKALHNLFGSLAFYFNALINFIFLIPVIALWSITIVALIGLFVTGIIKLFIFFKNKFFGAN